MVLLKLLSQFNIEVDRVHLHSNMVLLKFFGKDKIDIATELFTFQYGTT